jgi:alkylation response protein AidB-like acyl-CoA dehydrogenase
MDFAYSPEQTELRQLAADIFDSADDMGHQARVEQEAEWFDRELWRRLADAGLLGVTIPTGEESGDGLGFDLLEACIVSEQCGRTLGHVPFVPTVIGGVLPVARYGSAELKKEILGGVVNGTKVMTVAIDDQDASAPLLAQPAGASAASRLADGTEWRLSGCKSFVSYAHVADYLVVATGDRVGSGGLFLVDRDAAGMTLERLQTMSGGPQYAVCFNQTPGRALVPPGPEGTEAVQWLRRRYAVGYCALELGIADAALRMTAQYTKGRVQFDRPIATFQAVQHRLADAYIDVLAMRWTMLEAAALLGRSADEDAAAGGGAANEAVATAKWWACQGGHRVVSAAQHCHGGVGVDSSYPLSRYFLWSKEVEILVGSASQHLAELGRQIAGGAAHGAPA